MHMCFRRADHGCFVTFLRATTVDEALLTGMRWSRNMNMQEAWTKPLHKKGMVLREAQAVDNHKFVVRSLVQDLLLQPALARIFVNLLAESLQCWSPQRLAV